MPSQIPNSVIFNALTVPDDNLSRPSLRHNSRELQTRVVNIIEGYAPEYFGIDDEPINEEFSSFIYKYCANIVRMWRRGTCVAEFKKSYEKWLEEKLILPSNLRKKSFESLNKVGRPEKPFCESSDKSKKRKVEALIENVSKEELLYATRYALNKEGERSAAVLIKEITDDSQPERALQIKKVLRESEKNSNDDQLKEMKSCDGLGMNVSYPQ